MTFILVWAIQVMQLLSLLVLTLNTGLYGAVAPTSPASSSRSELGLLMVVFGSDDQAVCRRRLLTRRLQRMKKFAAFNATNL
jgi:hypothetical protein